MLWRPLTASPSLSNPAAKPKGESKRRPNTSVVNAGYRTCWGRKCLFQSVMTKIDRLVVRFIILSLLSFILIHPPFFAPLLLHCLSLISCIPLSFTSFVIYGIFPSLSVFVPPSLQQFTSFIILPLGFAKRPLQCRVMSKAIRPKPDLPSNRSALNSISPWKPPADERLRHPEASEPKAWRNFGKSFLRQRPTILQRRSEPNRRTRSTASGICWVLEGMDY